MENKNLVITRKQTPKQITTFGVKASKQLMDIVSQTNWTVNIQGNKYLRFEGWQTVGKFFGYTVKTEDTKYVEFGEAKGFEAKSVVLDQNGIIIGGAEAVCLNDEKNWKDKPLYALKSMAQTRSAAKAFRNILSWVVVLAGYSPTPMEEIGAEVEESIKEQKTTVQEVNGKCTFCGATGKYHAPNCPDNPKNENQETSLDKAKSDELNEEKDDAILSDEEMDKI